jgi:hypothetical protein
MEISIKTYKHLKALGHSDTEIAEHFNVELWELTSFVTMQKALRSPGRPTQAPIVDGMKVCTKCKLPRPLEAYDRNRAKPGGIVAQCKTCLRPPKPSPLDSDPETVAFKLKIEFEGIEAAKQELDTIKTKIAALRASLKASEHTETAYTRALDTYHLDN